MEKYKYISIILSLICAYLLFKCSTIDKPKDNSNHFIIQKDTIIVNKKEIVKIDKIVPKIIVKRDTVITTKPFVATIDTILKRDTIYLRFDFPENLFSFKYSPATDTIKIDKIYEYHEQKQSWIEKAVFFIAGYGISYIIYK